VRIYGEMVALLWDAGNVTAAIALEALWNDLGRRLPFSLFCAYDADTMGGEDCADSFRHVCHLHSAVVDGSPTRTSSDHAVLVARAEDARSFACELPSPGLARRFVADTLRAWGLGALVADASLVVAELATNCVLHARSEFIVGVSTHDDVVRLSVRDASSALPSLRTPEPSSGSGRGLMLVGRIARRWGVELIADGKLIWAELTSR
jgi:anti-sigma regulatory factor (Ser/Thr protein kinase)